MLPAGVAYVGALIVGAAVSAARSGGAARHVLELVALEGVLVAGISAAQRAIQKCRSDRLVEARADDREAPLHLVRSASARRWPSFSSLVFR